MSEAKAEHLAQEQRADGGDGPESVEAKARRMGWKPAEDYKGPAGGWRSAEEFVARGEQELPILRERLRTQERKFLGVEAKLDEAKGVIDDLTTRFRTADERAYKRARADLLKEREKAVEVGDTAEFRRLEGELQDLDASAPAAPVEKKAPPAQAGAVDLHPDTIAWDRANPWFRTNPDLAQFAMQLHNGLLQSEPDLAMRDNLDRVTRAVKAAYPDRFEAPAVPENPRREEAGAVGGSSPAGGRPKANPHSFEAMPADSKQAYEKYSKALVGKGKPLTKDEWAQMYWSQFEQ